MCGVLTCYIMSLLKKGELHLPYTTCMFFVDTSYCSKSLTLMYQTLTFFHFFPSVRIFCLNLTKMCKITKIPLVIFLIFLFNLTTIFNGREYLKRNENSIHQSKRFWTMSEYLRKVRKFMEGKWSFPKKKKKKKTPQDISLLKNFW